MPSFRRSPALLFVAAAHCFAWHHPVHIAITAAAMSSLPEPQRARWSTHLKKLIENYCLYPDFYHDAAPADRALMRPYCEKPDGKPIHNVTWRKPEDLASLEHALDGIVDAIRAGDAAAATQHAGVLAHFLEDSTCPAHSLAPLDGPLNLMKDLLPPPAAKRDIRLHTVIENSAPAFDLRGHTPQPAGNSVPAAAETLLERTYSLIRTNRANLIDLVRAVYADDDATVNNARREAAHSGAELLADAYETAFSLAGK